MNFYKVLFNATPHDIRRFENFRELLFIVARGVEVIYNLFSDTKERLNLYKFYNTQVISLEAFLSKYGDPITVSDYATKKKYIRNDEEIKTLDDDGYPYDEARLPFRMDGESGTVQYIRTDDEVKSEPSFTVTYPSTLSTKDKNNLKAEVEAIRPAGRIANFEEI